MAAKRPVIGERGIVSLTFALDGTETFGGTPGPKLIGFSDETTPVEIPKLVRLRSYGQPFEVNVEEQFPFSNNKNNFEVPGGSTVTWPGLLEVIAYGGVKVSAYATQARAVAKCELEIIPGIAHVPARAPVSTNISVDPDGEDPGAWTDVAWQQGGMPILSIVTDGGPIEFSFWTSASSAVLKGSWVVDGYDIPRVHPAPYRLKARHPGGMGAASRTAVLSWSRGVG